MAGGYFVLAQVGLFRETIVSGQGFIALGIVIFGRWNPLKATAAALVFGACDALAVVAAIFGTRIPPQLLLALPYVVTILAISGLFGGKAVQPAALMTPYVKDSRQASVCLLLTPARRSHESKPDSPKPVHVLNRHRPPRPLFELVRARPTRQIVGVDLSLPPHRRFIHAA